MKKNERKNNLTKVAAIVTILALTFLLAGCKRGKDNVEEPPVVEPEVTAEVTDTPEVPDEPTVEPSTEPEETPVEELTTAEWIKSLDFDEGKFIVFNETTGVREVLENGQEYIISETDTLALWKPSNWEYNPLISSSTGMSIKYGTKFGCLTVDFNYDEVEGETEIWTTFKDANSNDVDINVYLTKAQTTE